MSSSGILIVSAYGRGHWMAAQFSRMGIPTSLIDVSEKIGSWVPEEIEGPFGFFQDENLDESQVERLLEDDSFQEVKNGFTLWLKSGPLELKGPVTAHRLKQLDVGARVQNYILNPSYDQKRKLVLAPYSENWLAQLAHAYGSNGFYLNADFLEWGKVSPLFATFSVRMPSRQGHRRSLDWCRRLGVKVIEKSIVKDVSLRDRRTIRGLEYQEDQSEKSQHLDCEQLIWCLSSEETSMLNARLLEVFFPQGVLESEWYWARFRLKIAEGHVRDELPLHSVLIDDLGKPWTHDNFIILQKTGSSDFFDAWMKLPTVQRFNKDYLNMRGTELTAVLMNRFVQLKVDVASYPLGYDLTYNSIGPVRQPLYDPVVKTRWKSSHFQNVSLDSIEQGEGLGLQYQILRQKKIVQNIDQWWKKLLLKRNKNNEVRV